MDISEAAKDEYMEALEKALDWALENGGCVLIWPGYLPTVMPLARDKNGQPIGINPSQFKATFETTTPSS